jgi:hypothetical protein
MFRNKQHGFAKQVLNIAICELAEGGAGAVALNYF